MPKFSDEQYSDEKTVRRREAALKRMLTTPHIPHSESKIGNRSVEKKTSPSPKRPTITKPR
jgi:hypothetical protein